MDVRLSDDLGRVAVAMVAAAPASLAARWVVTAYAPESRERGWAAPIVLAVFASAALATPNIWILAASLVLGWALICLALVDLACLRLPDTLTFPLVALGLAIALSLPDHPFVDHVAGAIVGAAALALLAALWRHWRKVDGVGLGDAKLLGAAGAWLGWQSLPSVVVVASLLAFAGIALARLMGHRMGSNEPLPFGAPLALAIWLVWLGGPLTL